MSWKKNAFSYSVWVCRTIMTGIALAGAGSVLGRAAGFSAPWGIAAAVLYVILAGGIVFALHKAAPGLGSFADGHRGLLNGAEVLTAAVLTVAGLWLRMRGMENIAQTSEYYEAARVAAEQKIPQMVHGAAYLYVQALHGVFVLLGNYFAAGLWLQTVLQLAASLFLFLILRKAAGRIAALTVFGFCMCAPYMVGSAMTLSPDMLFFCILILALVPVATGYKGKLEPVRFFFAGILTAVCAYLDIMGILLLIPICGAVFCVREEEADPERKAGAVICCLVGAVLGFAACISMDALMSGKTFAGVTRAWCALYAPGEFRVPADVKTSGPAAEHIVLLALLTSGIFSFWCDRERERISPCVLGVCCLMPACCFGMFTEEMPGYFFLYLLLVVLAGIELGQCFHRIPAEVSPTEVRPDEGLVWENLEESEIIGLKDETESEETRENGQSGEPESEEPGEAGPEEAQEAFVRNKEIQYIENPLPLPKKHVKRVMDYPLRSATGDDYDYNVAEDDDFDI